MTPSTDEQRLIDTFSDALWMERGLSRNTLSAYQTDLRKASAWLLESRKLGLLQAQRNDLLSYLALLVSHGHKPRSSARMLSTLRQFYQHALRENWIQRDPSARIEAPKIGRPLPASLTETEVEALLKAPELDDLEGYRDRAMLEVLYATGLRVSELIDLKPEQVSLTQGVVRVVGKGGKERLVPMGEEAQTWLEKFIRGPRHELLGMQGLRTSLSHPAWQRHDPTGFLVPDKEACAGCWYPQEDLAPHAAACLCDPPAQPWCRPACGPAPVGSQ